MISHYAGNFESVLAIQAQGFAHNILAAEIF
jgi:hypothetical protein